MAKKLSKTCIDFLLGYAATLVVVLTFGSLSSKVGELHTFISCLIPPIPSETETLTLLYAFGLVVLGTLLLVLVIQSILLLVHESSESENLMEPPATPRNTHTR